MSTARARRLERTLSPREARALYDRLGALLETQSFYEDPALAALVRHARFEEARAVFEFGCGTGRFAARLLSTVLPPASSYLGVDVSPTMVRLARARLAPWAARARVELSDGSTACPAAAAGVDRFVCTYVLDLLGAADIRGVLTEAQRLLAPGGLLCVACLTEGERPLARLVSAVWRRLAAVRPALVGGCRPVRVLEHLPAGRWTVEHREVVAAFGVSSEVLVATPGRA